MPYTPPRPPAATSGPGTCPQCWQRVLWTITAAGRRQAVNAAPDPAGRVAVYCDGTGRWRSRQLSNDRPIPEHNEALYMAHAATCANPQPKHRALRTPRHRLGVRPAPWRQR
jgi:hypothetical protein